MHQWNGRRVGDVLTAQTDVNAIESPDASLHRSVKTAIAQHKQSLVRVQSSLRKLSATLTQIKEKENEGAQVQSNTFKKS